MSDKRDLSNRDTSNKDSVNSTQLLPGEEPYRMVLAPKCGERHASYVVVSCHGSSPYFYRNTMAPAEIIWQRTWIPNFDTLRIRSSISAKEPGNTWNFSEFFSIRNIVPIFARTRHRFP
jgi:hypothetical protein